MEQDGAAEERSGSNLLASGEVFQRQRRNLILHPARRSLPPSLLRQKKEGLFSLNSSFVVVVSVAVVPIPGTGERKARVGVGKGGERAKRTRRKSLRVSALSLSFRHRASKIFYSAAVSFLFPSRLILGLKSPFLEKKERREKK